MTTQTTQQKPDGDDQLKQWLDLGREVLRRYYPDTRYAVLVAEQGDGMPSVTLPVIPAASFPAAPVRLPE